MPICRYNHDLSLAGIHSEKERFLSAERYHVPPLAERVSITRRSRTEQGRIIPAPRGTRPISRRGSFVILRRLPRARRTHKAHAPQIARPISPVILPPLPQRLPIRSAVLLRFLAEDVVFPKTDRTDIPENVLFRPDQCIIPAAPAFLPFFHCSRFPGFVSYKP